jgi:hypothetical protein
MNPDQRQRAAQISKALRIILEPGQVTELRALDVIAPNYRAPHTVSGYFDDPDKLAEAAAQISSAKGIYFIPNPVNPALLARAANRIRPVGKEPTTSDTDIIARHWLLVDIDPKRPAGISSSEAEHEAALKKGRQIQKVLSEKNWPIPILGDSGNGGHLLYRIDLPLDDKGLVQKCLEALAFWFDDPYVTIDQKVFNPARIWKLYGTWACKGDSTLDRPHRLSCIIEAPNNLIPVFRELLETLAASIPTLPITEKKTHPGNKSKLEASFDLERWIIEHNLEVTGPTDWKDGKKWIFPVCPWNSSHTNRSAFIVQLSNGAISAGCHHNSCQGNTWPKLREQVEPSVREKQGTSQSQTNVSHSLKQNALTSVVKQEDSQKEVDDQDEKVETPSWPDPISEKAYYGLAGDIVQTIEPHTEADSVALLIQTLISFGNTIGRSAYFIAEADNHYLNMFGVLVGISSKGRKGSSWGHIRRIFGAVDPRFKERVSSGLSSGEGLIFAVRDSTIKMEPVREKGKRTGKYEEIIEDQGIEDKRRIVFESEYAQVLKVLSREGNTLSSVIRQAWDTGDLGSLTKNNRVKASDAHISIIGHVTKEELCRYLTETECGNGFGNRFLWLCVRRSKLLPEGGKIQEVDFTSLVQRLAQAIQFASKIGEMKKDKEAKKLWIEVYPDLSEGKPGLLGAMTGRAEAQVMRLACIYALLDLSAVIQVEHLLAALAVWKYAYASCKFIFGDSLGDPEADELLKAIRAASDGLSQKEIIHEVFNRNKTSKQIGRILSVLLEHGLIGKNFCRLKDGSVGGKPALRYFALRP